MSQLNRKADQSLSFMAVPHSVDSLSTLSTQLAATSLSTNSPELPTPSSLRPADYTSAHLKAQVSCTSPKELAASNFKDARRRIDEVAEVI